MSERSNSQSGGISFCGLLAIVFITLKLLGIITWSWWLVLAPIWIPILFALGVFAICGTIILAAYK